MNTCLNTGSTATALGPTAASSVGTSRQPISRWPSSATIDGEELLDGARAPRRRAAGRPGRRRTRRSAAAGPARPCAGSCPASGSGCRRRRRCSPRSRRRRDGWRLIRTCSACCTIACDLRPLMSTTKPTPQASCSCRGSYNLADPAWRSVREVTRWRNAGEGTCLSSITIQK